MRPKGIGNARGSGFRVQGSVNTPDASREIFPPTTYDTLPNRISKTPDASREIFPPTTYDTLPNRISKTPDASREIFPPTTCATLPNRIPKTPEPRTLTTLSVNPI